MVFEFPSYDARGNARVRNSRTGDIYASFDDVGGFDTMKDIVRLEDDFLGDALDARWSGGVGSDPQAVTPTINAQVGGVVRLTCGDAGTGAAADGSSLTHGLNWKASNTLVFEARIKPVSSVATVKYFVGFTDTLATTTVEMPFTLSGTTLTSTATDAVGLLFDTNATNDYWHMCGVATDVDAFNATTSNTGRGPSADTWSVIRIEVDASGTATFYIDDLQVGTLASSVTTSVSLTPIVIIDSTTTTVRSLDCDFVKVYSQR